MVSVLFIDGIIIILLGLILLLKGPDLRDSGEQVVRWLKSGALAPLAIQGIIFIIYGITEIANGDAGGVIQFLALLPIALLAYNAWRRPLEAGLLMILAGIVSVIPLRQLSAFATLSLPLLASGILFFSAGMTANSKKSEEA